MSDHTHIQWTDSTWNPVVGCTRASSGCDNCYAVAMTKRLAGMGQERYQGLVNPGKDHFNGKVRFVPEVLDKPLRRRKPTRYFVNSMSDLFHEAIPDEWIDQVFAVMAMAQRHQFQVLTKRPERMRGYVSSLQWERLIECCNRSADGGPHRPGAYSLASIDGLSRKARFVAGEKDAYRPLPKLPLPNVWLGISAEDQQRADERTLLLLDTPAAVRFVCAEPLLGPINLRQIEHGDLYWLNALTGITHISHDGGMPNFPALPGLDWVIVGGESGKDARPMALEWARSIVKQCRTAGVACFVKQLGARPVHRPAYEWADGGGRRPYDLNDRKGGNINEFPSELRVREMPA